MNFKVTGLQLAIRDALSVDEKEANVEEAIRAIEACDDCDLVVLPELCTVGYGDDVFKRLPATADALDGETIRRFRRAARSRGVHAAIGFAERDGERVYNSVAIVDDLGMLVDVYRKVHLPQFEGSWEKTYFAAGDRSVSFAVNGLRVGVLVCFDIRFPDVCRKLAFDDDVDLLIHPTGFFRDETFASWHPFVVTRAIENQAYLLSVNRAGAECGHSILAPPLLDWPSAISTLGAEPGALACEVDQGVLARVRAKYQYRRG
jgi:omega-amidase